MTVNINFYRVEVVGPDGRPRQVMIGFASNGTMWFEMCALGLGPPEARVLLGKLGNVFVDHRRQLAFVNALALAGLIDDPQLRAQWLAYVESMLKEHREVRARYESARNN